MRYRQAFCRLFLSTASPENFCQNFLSFHVAILILTTPCTPACDVRYANRLLRYFVKSFAAAYSEYHVTHNVHGLCHLASDVEHVGPLDAWRAFPFKNHMLTLKRMVHKPQYPRVQLCYRLAEKGVIPKNIKSLQVTLVCPLHDSGPLVASCQDPQFKKVMLPGNVVLGVARNSCCLLSDGFSCYGFLMCFHAT